MEICGLVFFGVLAMLVVGSVGYYQLEDRKKKAQAAADALGLTVQGVDELVGQYQGVGIRMYSRDHGGSSSTEWWTYTRCTLIEDLPTGMVVVNQGFFGHLADLVGAVDIQLGSELDPKLRISGQPEADVRALLNESGVTGALWEILGGDSQVELRDGELLVKAKGRHIEYAELRAVEAVNLVLALARARRGPWDALARAHDLAQNGSDEMVGVIRGIGVQLQVDGGPNARTVIQAVLDRPLPADSEVWHSDHHEGQRLGDPILDAMVAASSSDLDALRVRLCTDEARGPLLEVVHGFPGSSLRSDQVVLVAAGRLTQDLERATNAVVDLALALRG